MEMQSQQKMDFIFVHHRICKLNFTDWLSFIVIWYSLLLEIGWMDREIESCLKLPYGSDIDKY